MNKAERKEYDRARYLANKDYYAENSRKWRVNNPEKMKELTDAWRKKNPERWVALVRRGQRKNPGAMYQANIRRRAAHKKATPKWRDKNSIERIYAEAKRRGLEVDHRVPLNNQIVCGLHCEANLRLVTKSENSRKGNRFWEHMP